MSTDLGSLYGSTYGSLYFATIMSTAFYGVACMQTFFYYVHYQNDPWRVKIFVAVMWALNSVHEALGVAGAYKNILAGLLDPFSFVSGNPELVLLFLFTVLVAIPTQGFFVYRIYIFSGKNVVAPLIFVALAAAQLVCIAVYVARTLYSGDVIQVAAIGPLDTNSTQTLATASFAIAAGIDILIAGFMTFLLIRKRATANFTKSAHILQRLTVFSVNTGIWTATFALLSLIFLRVDPSNLIYAVFGIPLCPIYCNTLLANLNARQYVRGESATVNINLDLFSISGRSHGSDGTQVETHRGDTSLLVPGSQVVWKTTEVSTDV